MDIEAPDGYVWVCAHCNRLSERLYGDTPEWTTECIKEARLFKLSLVEQRKGKAVWVRNDKECKS